jgi:hypothetical protein
MVIEKRPSSRSSVSKHQSRRSLDDIPVLEFDCKASSARAASVASISASPGWPLSGSHSVKYNQSDVPESEEQSKLTLGTWLGAYAGVSMLSYSLQDAVYMHMFIWRWWLRRAASHWLAYRAAVYNKRFHSCQSPTHRNSYIDDRNDHDI